MILMFLGSLRATVAVFFSIPLSVCATFFVLQLGGSSVNSMVLGGLGAGAVAADRQFGGRARKHLSPSGNGRTAPGRRGDRRERSRAAGAGFHADHRCGLLPGDAAGGRQQVSVFGDGAGGGGFSFRLLLRRDDGCAAVLRPLSETENPEHISGTDSAEARTLERKPDWASTSTRLSMPASTGCSRLTKRWCSKRPAHAGHRACYCSSQVSRPAFCSTLNSASRTSRRPMPASS